MTASSISIIIHLALLFAVSSIVYSFHQQNTADVANSNDVEVEEGDAREVDTNTNIIIHTRKMKTLSNKSSGITKKKIAAAGKPTTADLLPAKHKHRRAKASKRGKQSKSKKKKHNLFDEHCNMDVFKDQYLYANGCGGKSYAVDIYCDLDSSDKRQRCVYEEHSVSFFNSLIYDHINLCLCLCVYLMCVLSSHSQSY